MIGPRLCVYSALLASGLILAAARPHESQLRVLETAHLPQEWSQSDAHPDEPLHLRVSLKHPHEDYLDIAREVSDPSSSRYGQHPSADELTASLPDLTSAAAAVVGWLKTSGVHAFEEEDEWISFSTTARRARHLLAADFRQYYHSDASDSVLRTTKYSIPEHLHDHVDFIYPTVHFMDFNRKPRQPVELEKRQHLPPANPNCTNSVCPKEVASLYKINYQAPDAKSGSKIGVAGFLKQNAHHSDLQAFLKGYGLAGQQFPFDFDVQTIQGGKDNQSSTSVGNEADVDIQYVSVFSDSLAATFYSVGGRPPTLSQPGNKPVPMTKAGNEPYLAFFNFLAKQTAPPQVISISYSDDEQTVHVAFALQERSATLSAALLRVV